nr:retrovirus-related Pol polyprotein from transposon TNT 1-94 [Tanacetum cinerariifolium]
MTSTAPQDRWSQDKHIELVNIIGDQTARILTRSMAKELSAASAHECLFVDFLSKEDLKRVEVDFPRLIWEDLIHKLNRKIKDKVVLYPMFISLLLEYMMLEYENEELTLNPTSVFRVHNWTLKPNQSEGPPFTDHMKAIYNIDVPVESQAPKTSLKTKKKVPQGKKSRARSGLKRKQSSKHASESKTKASKSKTRQSDKDTQSSSVKDKGPSHPLSSILVVSEMHKEAQQAVSGLTFLSATSEERAYPQLSSVDFTTGADFRISNPNDIIPEQQDKTKSTGDGLKTTHTDLGTNEESKSDEISKKIKLEDLLNLMQDTWFAFLTPNSPQDEHIIVSDESEKEEMERYKDTHTTSHDEPEDSSIPHPPSPKSVLIQELMAQAYLLQS